MKKRKPYEYQRILEILDDYWLSEPDEYEVIVEMKFLKSDGQHQEKCIIWRNENYTGDAESDLIQKKHRIFFEKEGDFADYVISQYYGEDSPKGDFAKDTCDSLFPYPVSIAMYRTRTQGNYDGNIRVILDYIKQHGCDEAVKVCKKLIKEYEAVFL